MPVNTAQWQPGLTIMLVHNFKKNPIYSPGKEKGKLKRSLHHWECWRPHSELYPAFRFLWQKVCLDAPWSAETAKQKNPLASVLLYETPTLNEQAHAKAKSMILRPKWSQCGFCLSNSKHKHLFDIKFTFHVYFFSFDYILGEKKFRFWWKVCNLLKIPAFLSSFISHDSPLSHPLFSHSWWFFKTPCMPSLHWEHTLHPFSALPSPSWWSLLPTFGVSVWTSPPPALGTFPEHPPESLECFLASPGWHTRLKSTMHLALQVRNRLIRFPPHLRLWCS